MKYKKSPLDYFLQQRISDNAKELKNTLNEHCKWSKIV